MATYLDDPTLETLNQEWRAAEQRRDAKRAELEALQEQLRGATLQRALRGVKAVRQCRQELRALVVECDRCREAYKRRLAELEGAL